MIPVIWFLVSRIGCSVLIASLAGWLLVKQVKRVRTNLPLVRFWNIVLLGTPFYLLSLFVIGYIIAWHERITAPPYWEFSGFILGAHLGLMLWSLPFIGLAHMIGGVIVRKRKIFIVLAALYFAIFITTIVILKSTL